MVEKVSITSSSPVVLEMHYLFELPSETTASLRPISSLDSIHSSLGIDDFGYEFSPSLQNGQPFITSAVINYVEEGDEILSDLNVILEGTQSPAAITQTKLLDKVTPTALEISVIAKEEPFILQSHAALNVSSVVNYLPYGSRFIRQCVLCIASIIFVICILYCFALYLIPLINGVPTFNMATQIWKKPYPTSKFYEGLHLDQGNISLVNPYIATNSTNISSNNEDLDDKNKFSALDTGKMSLINTDNTTFFRDSSSDGGENNQVIAENDSVETVPLMRKKVSGRVFKYHSPLFVRRTSTIQSCTCMHYIELFEICRIEEKPFERVAVIAEISGPNYFHKYDWEGFLSTLYQVSFLKFGSWIRETLRILLQLNFGINKPTKNHHSTSTIKPFCHPICKLTRDLFMRCMHMLKLTLVTMKMTAEYFSCKLFSFFLKISVKLL